MPWVFIPPQYRVAFNLRGMETYANPKNKHDERRSKQEDFSTHHVYKLFLLLLKCLFLLCMSKKTITACTLYRIYKCSR